MNEHKKIVHKLILFSVLSTTALLIAILAAILFDFQYYFLSLLVIPFLILIVQQYSKLKRTKLLLELREKWGTFESKESDIPEIHLNFNKYFSDKQNPNNLDDRTWNDLDMDEIYSQINRTQTSPGKNVLYSMLRKPLLKKEKLDERNNLIKLFFADRDKREKLQINLSKFGNEKGSNLAELLWGDRPTPSKKSQFLILLVIAIPVFLLLGLLHFNFAWFFLAAIVLTNMIIHYRAKERLYEHLSSIKYIGIMIRCARSLSKEEHSLLKKLSVELHQSLLKVSRISKKIGLLGLGGSIVFFEYLNIIFLSEVRAFHSVLKVLDSYEKELQKIYLAIGFLDSLIAIASFRSGLKYYSEPLFMSLQSYIQIKDLYHPLLSEPVPNSIKIESKGILITGSNMAGKTTFLKAVAISVILAQTINTVPSQAYKSGFFNIITLIGRTDNVITGKSYYMDEIQALLRIIKSINTKVTVLCLLDEIFRGTNSQERIVASVEVLQYLSRQNCISLVTTHEYELTELVRADYSNYHFGEDVKIDQGILFDYKIRKGPLNSGNAINLLRYTGYPEEIVKRAEKRISKQL